MDLTSALQLISTTALVAGVLFAAFEIRLARRRQTHEAELLLVASFQSNEFNQAMGAVLGLPDGLSKGEIEGRLGERVFLVAYWLSTMEWLGSLVRHREIELRMVDEFFGGPVLISWRKLGRYVADQRTELERDSMGEWFQWLAERVADFETTNGRIPANIRDADWKP